MNSLGVLLVVCVFAAIALGIYFYTKKDERPRISAYGKQPMNNALNTP